MTEDYSRTALLRFLDTLGEKGLANSNTAQSYKVAVGKVLSDASPEDEADVRQVNVELAVRRFNNKNPGVLSPNSLTEYRRRVESAIKEFVRYTDNPLTYTPIGRNVNRRPENGDRRPDRRPSNGGTKRAQPQQTTELTPEPAAAPQKPGMIALPFPIRPDLLARIEVPIDMKTDEAKRLSAFIMTLATDFAPTS
jgi:hypothetical protein